MPRRGGSTITGFPDEILQEILVRLPAKSVLRCRAVCRGWRGLTSDPDFLVAHHRRQPTLHLISSFRTTGDHLHRDSLDAVDLQGGELWPRFQSKKCLRMVVDASCDGLVVMGNRICNPTTHQWAPLSLKVQVRNLVGLFRHQPSGEYRMLFWRTSSHRHQYYCPNDYCVLAVGSDNDPRPVPSPPPVSGPISIDGPAVLLHGRVVELELINAAGPTFIGTPLLLHGNMHLHWKRYREGRCHKILVFDTVAESFRHMRSPAVNPRHVMQLFDMDGTLAASCSKDAMMEMRIFALQDYESEVWSFQYRIKLPEVEIRRFQERGNWLAKVVSKEGDLLVSCFGWLLHCDRKGNLVAKFRYDDDLPMVIPHVLKESLIQHTFFQKD